VRWKAIPLSGQYVVLAADWRNFLESKASYKRRKRAVKQSSRGLKSQTPPLEGIDKTGDYRYDLPRFHIGASFSHRALPPTEIEQPSLNFFEERQ
jgi:hypothetical protein